MKHCYRNTNPHPRHLLTWRIVTEHRNLLTVQHLRSLKGSSRGPGTSQDSTASFCDMNNQNILRIIFTSCLLMKESSRVSNESAVLCCSIDVSDLLTLIGIES
uniref:Uncharacterized protein n=1 Tax=Guillardia theta TaxID=55529 RepID=A0A6U5YPM0_GUITH|mmetsp:Transcript_22329/g.73402  ORF Transcript_22329/g.73402 Transcript_22329/m.73402 type:complete len:103 (+) Transcript_22329:565-873(+)